MLGRRCLVCAFFFGVSWVLVFGFGCLAFPGLVFFGFWFLTLAVLAFLAVRPSPSFQPMHSANVSVGYDLTFHSDRTSYPASAMARTSSQKVCMSKRLWNGSTGLSNKGFEHRLEPS